jgi:hypothetical protein
MILDDMANELLDRQEPIGTAPIPHTETKSHMLGQEMNQ